jgi:hypothetical protein
LYLYRRLVSTEREVLHALRTGLDGHAIADQLHISIRTERNHVTRILGKLRRAGESPPTGGGRRVSMSPTAATPSARTRRWILSIMSQLSQLVRRLTSNEANTDVPPGIRVPPTDEGAVPRPDREPVAGFEPERES